MSKNLKKNIITYKAPRRCDIWLVVDRDEKVGDKETREYESSVQKGTRLCVIVSNDTGNTCAPIVEVVYTTTKKKNKMPTHFLATSTPEPSTVLCEQVMTVSKKDLIRYYGTLNMKEKSQLNKCLKVSLDL